MTRSLGSFFAPFFLLLFSSLLKPLLLGGEGTSATPRKAEKGEREKKEKEENHKLTSFSPFCLPSSPPLPLLSPPLPPPPPPSKVVGWYHSHPGFGCWLSGVDIGTQQSFEALNARAVAVVVDPIQSVRGKVVLDAFRLINPQTLMLGQEPRQCTSNVGHLARPSIQALIHGLNRHYYSIAVSYRKTPAEERALAALKKRGWAAGLALRDFEAVSAGNEAALKEVARLAKEYAKSAKEEGELDPLGAERDVARAGRSDARGRLGAAAGGLVAGNVVQATASILDALAL